jgi:hypothetical protein
MAREHEFHPGVKLEGLEGRQLTTSLAVIGTGLAGVVRPPVEVRNVTATNLESIHSYHGGTGFFVS